MLELSSISPVRAETADVPVHYADVDILASLALYHLRTGEYAKAREETAPILEEDRSGRARYLHGVACLYQQEWDCAVRMLQRIAYSANAASFPRLPLELGYALVQSGQVARGRAALEEAALIHGLEQEAGNFLAQLGESLSTHAEAPQEFEWNAVLSAGAGFDTNVPGTSTTTGELCAPTSLGDLTFKSGCAATVIERTGLRVISPLLGRTFKFQYLFQHSWHPDRALALFDLQEHRASAAVSVTPGVEAGSSLELISLNARYLPTYELSWRAAVRFRGLLAMHTSGWLEPGLTLAGFHDLERIWALDGEECDQVTDSSEDSSDSRFCTGGQSGARPTLDTGADTRVGPLKLSLVVTGGWNFSRASTYRGLDTGSVLSISAPVTGWLHLQSGVSATYRRYTAQEPAWSLFRVQPQIAARIQLGSRLSIWTRYFVSFSRIRDVSDLSVDDYRRQFGTMELAYDYGSGGLQP